MSDIFDPLEPSPYKVLDVSQDATIQEIRSSHRRLVLKYHPDKVQNESEKAAKTERFQEIQQAYEILQDDGRRARWDDRAAERDRQMSGRRMPRKTSSYTPARSGPVFEQRDGVIYEERVPKWTRVYEENTFDAAFGGQTTSPSSRRFDEDRYHESSPRKTSWKYSETRSRNKEAEDDYIDQKAREKKQKEDFRKVQQEKEKQRDKAKKQDREARFSSRRTRVDDYSNSDEYEDRHYSSKSDSKSKSRGEDRYRDEPSYRGSRKDSKQDDSDRYREEPPFSSSKIDSGPNSLDLDRKINHASKYIYESKDSKSGSKRTGHTRGTKMSSVATPPSTPRDRDSGRRSSGDDGRKSSRTTRPRSPPRSDRYKVNEAFPRSSPAHEARNLPKEMTMPSRSKTSYQNSSPIPGLSRSQTMPLQNSKSSTTKKHQFDDVSSDSSSLSEPETSDSEFEEPPFKPKRPGPQPSQTKYSYRVNNHDNGPQVVTAEPESYFDSRPRDDSPKSAPRRSNTGDRYVPSAARTPLKHAATFQERPSPRQSESRQTTPQLRSTFSAHDSRKDSNPLFGEFYADKPSPRSTHSPNPSYVDAKFQSGRTSASHSRRSSEDVHPDYVPRSSMREHHRRGYSSREIKA